MTAEVFSVDGARVSAREAIPGWEIDLYDKVLPIVAQRLRRKVKREADKAFGSAPRRTIVYLTVEEVVEVPESDAAA